MFSTTQPPLASAHHRVPRRHCVNVAIHCARGGLDLHAEEPRQRPSTSAEASVHRRKRSVVRSMGHSLSGLLPPKIWSPESSSSPCHLGTSRPPPLCPPWLHPQRASNQRWLVSRMRRESDRVGRAPRAARQATHGAGGGGVLLVGLIACSRQVHRAVRHQARWGRTACRLSSSRRSYRSQAAITPQRCGSPAWTRAAQSARRNSLVSPRARNSAC